METLKELLASITENRLRLFLTAFGVFWGIFILVLLLGAGRGIQNGVTESFGPDLANFIIISPAATSLGHKGMPIGRGIYFKESDVNSIKQNVDGIALISSSINGGSQTAYYHNRSGSFPLIAVADDYFKMQNQIVLRSGRYLHGLDNSDYRKIIFIGEKVAERLLGGTVNAIGKEIKIKGIPLLIAGTFSDTKFGRRSDHIFIPQETYKHIFEAQGSLNDIWIMPRDKSQSTAIEAKIITQLKQRHSIHPEDKRALKSINMIELNRKVDHVFLGISSFIWFIGIGTLVAGTVSVSNIMIITVKERSKEIGLRKALGATPQHITINLLFESLIITSCAGALGLLAGISLLDTIALALQQLNIHLPFFKNPGIDLHIGIAAIITLSLLGGIAGLIPAIKAARITPQKAMTET